MPTEQAKGAPSTVKHCVRHSEEPLAEHCRACGHPFCNRCLVWAFGPKKPPYCISCALSASGVRPGARPPVAPAPQQAAVPPVGRRAARIERRPNRSAEKELVRARRRARQTDEPDVADPHDEEPHDSRVPAPSQLAAALRATAVPKAGPSRPSAT